MEKWLKISKFQNWEWLSGKERGTSEHFGEASCWRGLADNAKIGWNGLTDNATIGWNEKGLKDITTIGWNGLADNVMIGWNGNG